MTKKINFLIDCLNGICAVMWNCEEPSQSSKPSSQKFTIGKKKKHFVYSHVAREASKLCYRYYDGLRFREWKFGLRALVVEVLYYRFWSRKLIVGNLWIRKFELSPMRVLLGFSMFILGWALNGLNSKSIVSFKSCFSLFPLIFRRVRDNQF